MVLLLLQWRCSAVALLLLPIGAVLVRRTAELGELSPKLQANFGAAIMCAIAFGATIGGMGSPIGTAPNALFFTNYEPLVEQGRPPVSFLLWLLAFAYRSISRAIRALAGCERSCSQGRYVQHDPILTSYVG